MNISVGAGSPHRSIPKQNFRRKFIWSDEHNDGIENPILCACHCFLLPYTAKNCILRFTTAKDCLLRLKQS